MSFSVIIPARLNSSRLPRKVLLDLHGLPVVQHVWQAAQSSGAARVVIATDHAEVQAVCQGFGAEVVLTGEHASGTDRLAEVVREWPEQVVVNVQGDEPKMPPALIAQAAALLDDPRADIGTLAHPIHRREDWLNPNFVKVVCDADGFARYFSRAPIPYGRDLDGHFPEGAAFKHIGLYSYRVSALTRFAALPPAPLEHIECLEQLRALHHGLCIKVAFTDTPPPRGVDTAEDLAFLRAL